SGIDEPGADHAPGMFGRYGRQSRLVVMAGAISNLLAIRESILESLLRQSTSLVDVLWKRDRGFRHTARQLRAGIFGHESTIDSSASRGRTLIRRSSRHVHTALSAPSSSAMSCEPASRAV